MRPQACMIIICAAFWVFHVWLIIYQRSLLAGVKNREEMCSFLNFWRKRDGPTDRLTDGPTNGWMDGRTDPLNPLEIAFFGFLFAARVLYCLAKYTLQNFFLVGGWGGEEDNCIILACLYMFYRVLVHQQVNFVVRSRDLLCFNESVTDRPTDGPTDRPTWLLLEAPTRSLKTRP